MPFIPEDIIEQIASRIDIVEVISSYIPLKRAGRNLKASCPFHSEKTPSFIVSPARQIYHCFGCGKGGNIFSFVMEYEKLAFNEAVEMFAKKAGIELPKSQRQESKSINSVIYEVNELACKWYENNLFSQSGNKGRNYLQQRNITEKTIKEFRLGFAGSGFDALLNFLRAKNFTLNVLEKSGLIVQKPNGGYRDSFYNRVIFPIIDIKDRVIGFGGRVLDNTLPKYINSPETPVYSKGKNLYGLNKAKEYVRQKDCLIVVEGYLDLITLNQNDIGYVVSSLGTALTEEQARLIKRFTNNVIMIFDSDKAGQIATLRTMDIFTQEDMNVKIVVLKEGHDPDSLIREQGVEKFSNFLISAVDLFAYKLKVLKSMFNLEEIHGKTKIIEEILRSIQYFKNEVVKSEYIRRLAQELNIDEEALKIELKKISSSNHKFERPKMANNFVSAQKPNAAERLFIKILLEEPEYILRARQIIHPSDLQDRSFAVLAKTLFDFSEKGQVVKPHQLMNYFVNTEMMSLISELLGTAEVFYDDKEIIMQDCIKRIKQNSYKNRMQNLHEQIVLAKGNSEKLNNLLEEYNALVKIAGKN